MAKGKSQKESDAVKKLKQSAIEADERITAAAEKAERMIDEAAALATQALSLGAAQGRQLLEHGPVIEKIDADISRDHDELIIVKEKLKDLSTEVQQINKIACDADNNYSTDHDVLTALVADFETVRSNQNMQTITLNTMQLAMQGIQGAVNAAVNVTPRLDALEVETATQKSESKSLVMEHINAILAALVVGLIGSLAYIMYLAKI